MTQQTKNQQHTKAAILAIPTPWYTSILFVIAAGHSAQQLQCVGVAVTGRYPVTNGWQDLAKGVDAQSASKHIFSCRNGA